MKRCGLADKGGVCKRETNACEFSLDCNGDYTREAVDKARADALLAYSKLKEARAEYIRASKLFGYIEERFTNKLTEWHLVETESKKWWKIL